MTWAEQRFAKTVLADRRLEWEFLIDGLGVIGGGVVDLGRSAGIAVRRTIDTRYFSLETFQAGAGASMTFKVDGQTDIYGLAFLIARAPGWQA